MHGSILLKSKQAFCFSGTASSKEILNSIERIQLGTESKWNDLAIDKRIPKTSNLAAASMFNRILVFGGSPFASYVSYFLSEEGEVIESISFGGFIPGAMG